MSDTPLTYTKPTDRRDRAESHWCDAVNTRIYCSKIDCQYCNGEEDT